MLRMQIASPYAEQQMTDGTQIYCQEENKSKLHLFHGTGRIQTSALYAYVAIEMIGRIRDSSVLISNQKINCSIKYELPNDKVCGFSAL